jgi:hypothetical protein
MHCAPRLNPQVGSSSQCMSFFSEATVHVLFLRFFCGPFFCGPFFCGSFFCGFISVSVRQNASERARHSLGKNSEMALITTLNRYINTTCLVSGGIPFHDDCQRTISRSSRDALVSLPK